MRSSSLQRGKGLARTPRKESRGEERLRERGNYGGTLQRDRTKALGTKRPESGSRRAVKAELDRLTSLIVRARDGRCVTCGTTENLECSHYFKRRFLATRWNLTNCNAQCARENEEHNRNPFRYRKYMVERYGEDALDELFKLRNSVWRPTDEELESLLESYRVMWRQMRKAA